MTDAERPDTPEEGAEELKPVIRDRRRIDPETGERRAGDTDPGAGQATPAAGAAVADGALADELAGARAEAAERLEDLRRLQAEYVNYRKRVERDRELVRENAKAEVLTELLSVLDDIGRAREHGDLTGAFRSVGEALEAVTSKVGLVRFGEPGDEFDPTIHEALMHGYADDVAVPTCTQILQPGYRVGERVIRPARVAVAEPTEALPSSPGADAGADGAETTERAAADNEDS
ncbi:nucleotide exchange factor GrpE [Jiangella gansuensis]|uniref:nucleotide exchange factor GrpE n=1 Tax=Jiangella gansuensis TaxID=281473 RepID=UPI0004B71FA3|nr:nucleotide exchange factor GrpE [Jiangella gansuensis]